MAICPYINIHGYWKNVIESILGWVYTLMHLSYKYDKLCLHVLWCIIKFFWCWSYVNHFGINRKLARLSDDCKDCMHCPISDSQIHIWTKYERIGCSFLCSEQKPICCSQNLQTRSTQIKQFYFIFPSQKYTLWGKYLGVRTVNLLSKMLFILTQNML